MNRSILMMTTNTASSVLANGIIPLTTVQLGTCKNSILRAGSNSILITAPGYYKINAIETFSAPEAGTVTMELQKNGVEVTGVTASTTITTADTEVRSLAVSGIVKVCCCDLPATLTLVNSGDAATIYNVEVDVEYLG